MQIIHKYFPLLSELQVKQFTDLQNLYNYWNSKVNLISRKDIDKLYVNHILHSLSISKVIKFKNQTKVLDLGTGGGFPGIPLAILFPKVDFLLVDSIGKKIKVVNEITRKTDLKNVRAIQDRGENIEETFDFIVSRAVTDMRSFKRLVKGRFNKKHNNTLNNGILYLKGGDLTEELKGIASKQYLISNYFEEDFFESKKIVYIRY